MITVCVCVCVCVPDSYTDIVLVIWVINLLCNDLIENTRLLFLQQSERLFVENS